MKETTKQALTGAELMAAEWGEGAKERRLELGLTQVETARRANVSQPVISDIEKGAYRSLNVDLMLRLSVALEIEPRELFGWPRQLLAMLQFQQGQAA